MGYRPPVAVLDACVLYPFHLRNLLVQCGVDRLIDPRWTDNIHDEWMRSLFANRPGLDERRLRATRDLMKSVLPSADVQGVDWLIAGIALPDPDDRHVVATAIAGGASVIVTWNTRDFPIAELARHGLVAQDPDMFLSGVCDAVPDAFVASAASARRNLRRSVPSAAAFLEELERQGLARLASRLRHRVAAL